MPTLDQWEKRLRPEFSRRLRMISEIPISRLELEDMLAEVRGAIRRLGLPKATDLLDKAYPYTFLVCLTFFSAYNTEADYWGALGDELGVDSRNLFNREWHKIYLRKIEKLGLRHFKDADSAHPYVTTIRYHGGIPLHSLPDYFRHFVLPSINRPGLNELSPRQARDALLQSVYGVDQVVIHFLVNSGELGEEFFEACRNLARHYQRWREILPASQLDLPERVVRAFESYMQEQAEDGPRLRLRRPVLLFSQGSEFGHLIVRLPEQEVPLRYAEGRFEWRFTLLGVGQTLRCGCRASMKRRHMIVEGQEYQGHQPIDACPAGIQATFVYRPSEKAKEEILGRWHLPVMPGPNDAQILAVRRDDVLIRPGEPLPGEALMLVFPADHQLQVEGEAPRIEAYGELSGAWKGWQAHEYDLSQAWSLRLTRDGKPVGDPLPVARKLPYPEISGQVSRWNVDPQRVPLYVGEAPMLRIPLRSDAPLGRSLGRWQLELSSVWSAQPEIDMKTRLNCFEDAVTLSEGWATLPLSKLLGSQPVGTYTLRLSGPIDEEIEFRFRVWPRLTLVGLKSALFPGSGGDEPQSFELILPDGAGCEVQPGAQGVRVEPTPAGFSVTAGPETVRADLNLVMERPGAEPIRLPVYISIPRLRWALVLQESSEQFAWHTRLFQEQLERVLQSESAALYVQLPGLESARWAAVELVEVGQEEKTLQREALEKTVAAVDARRLSLSSLRETLKHTPGVVRLDLLYRSASDAESLRIPLVLISRRLDVSEVKLVPLGDLHWHLTWKEAIPLKNRRVFLRPAWQPWQEGLEYVIPDDARGSMVLKDVGLPSTHYELYFYTTPPGEPPLRAFPADASVHRVELCTPHERLAELSEQLARAELEGNHEAAFRACMEAACIYQDIGDARMRDEKLGELSRSFTHISNLRLLLGLLDWLDAQQIEGPYNKFFRRSLFQPQLTRRIFERYGNDHPDLRAYLAYVPLVKDLYAETARFIARWSDDPSVLLACLRRLLQQEDPDLIYLIIELIETDRLTNRDAVELMLEKFDWVIKVFQDIPSTPFADRLLADLVIAQKAFDLDARKSRSAKDSDVDSIILRTLPYRDDVDPGTISSLLRVGMRHANPKSLLTTLMLYQQCRMDEAELLKTLSANPSFAVKTLDSLPPNEFHQALRESLIRQFPAIAGQVRLGARLITPLGVGVVKSIVTQDGKTLSFAGLGDQDVSFILAIGEGTLSIRVQLELSKGTLRFLDADEVWKCGHCGYAHPQRRCLDQHHWKSHRYQRLKMSLVPALLSIKPKDIKIVQ